ncbi:MAG TPA: inositol monophosphatase [Acidisoma sp.]|uniref:inositol monophosphatase family protein n=1 Tax=Acidisoma sp. TaxID=1872115 RepID=UPI002C554352|nr:inositol monophosphatase [Acidisoma sp.]HTI00064.1 inositol monophosphatase [Acidisoma sp.]
MSFDLDSRFDFGARLVDEAASLAMGYFQSLGSLTIKAKGPQDMASEADLNTEILIRDRLARAFPEDAFLGEETGRADAVDGARGIWVVDPIDGTQPFVSNMPNWCVSIAFVLDGRVELGFIAAPARGEIFIGRRGQGATLNGAPIYVRPDARITDGLTGLGYSSRIGAATFLPLLAKFLDAGGMFFRNGSGALMLCDVACGRLLGYVEPHINSWDCLAGLCIIEAAGGTVSDFLADDGMWSGHPLAAASPGVFPFLAGLVGVKPLVV